MATVDPNAVAELTAMGITEEDAVACLKACNGNPNTAAEYYWNGDLDKARQSIKWDESLWQNGDPAGGHSFNNNFVPQNSFTIHSNDVYNHPPLSIDPKSRPPSRANSTSAQIDDGEYSNRNAISNWAADVYQPYGSADDPELARALAASMGQETGTTTALNTSPVNPNFSRAPEGKTYDLNQWALATTTTTREVDLTPPAEERRRAEGQPAFLKPAKIGGGLAGALAVYACIPKAREALLALDMVADDYGSNKDWWNGVRIQEPRTHPEDESAEIARWQREFFRELQRLMSFLDGTARSYGSIEVLTKDIYALDQEIHKKGDPSKDASSSAIAIFFRVWRDAASSLFTELPPALTIFDAFAREQFPEDEASAGQHFQVIELNALPDLPTLDSLFRNLLWANEDNPVFLDTGDVFNIHVSACAGRPGLDIDIPEHFYPDRYTEEWDVVCKPLRNEMQQQREKIVELEVAAEKLSQFARRHDTNPNPKTYSSKQLLELTISHFETPLQKQSEDQDVDMDAPRLPDPTPVLKDLLRKLEAKLSSLTASQQEARRTLGSLASRFSTPDQPVPEGKSLTQYCLRGVVINTDITYLADTSNQWWKFTWVRPVAINTWDDPPAPHPVITRCTVDEAIRNARFDSETVLLIYAKSSTLAQPAAPLPAQLVDFVVKDNEHFAEELAGPKTGEDANMDIAETPGGADKKRRLSGAWLDDDSEAALRDGRMSPKRNSPFSSSSATLGGKSAAAGEGEVALPTLEEARGTQAAKRSGEKAEALGSDAVMEDVEERKGG